MRFAISRNAASRVLFPLLGLVSDRIWVDVDDATIRASFGWAGRVTIDRAALETIVHAETVPWWLGVGVHGNPFGDQKTWAFNGSRGGAVKLTLREPARGRVVGIPISADVVYLSLEDPEGFIAAVRR